MTTTGRAKERDRDQDRTAGQWSLRYKKAAGNIQHLFYAKHRAPDPLLLFPKTAWKVVSTVFCSDQRHWDPETTFPSLLPTHRWPYTMIGSTYMELSAMDSEASTRPASVNHCVWRGSRRHRIRTKGVPMYMCPNVLVSVCYLGKFIRGCSPWW